jgi:carboxypeptidase family protein
MRFWPLLLPLFTIAATAQNNSSARHATGTVTGHVYCADTNTPARTATVQLAPVKEREQRSGTIRFADMPAGGVAQTGLDGSFTLTRVPPGSYYVIVAKAGYLSPRPGDDDSDDVEPQPPSGQPPIVIPRVDVQADQSAGIDIRLERGAAISGAVRFDDGSPASGVGIMVLHRKKDKWVPSNGPVFAMVPSPSTDDLGHYRVAGLRDRDYVVMVQLSRTDLESRGTRDAGLSGIERSTLRIYSGDTPHISEAVPVKLGAGEEHSGEDITIPLSKFHSISGVVTAAADGHPINNGHLSIEDPTDKETVVDAELGSDGTFHLEGVPKGTYTLHVRSPQDQQFRELSVGPHQIMTDEQTIRQYSDLEQTLKVEGDIPSLVLTVTEKSKQHAAGSH